MSAKHLPQEPHDNAADQIIPLLWIRRSIGVLGILFPFILALGNYFFFECHQILPTISDYFHTRMMTIFVAIQSMISIFLWTYRGPKGEDKHWATLASVLCLGIALFPNDLKEVVKVCNDYTAHSQDTLHHICAISMFLILAYFSLFLFTKTNKNLHDVSDPDIQLKLKRNNIYKTCGYVILLSIFLVGVGYLLSRNGVNVPTTYIFWLESVALFAFGLSWITKGNWFIYGDKSSDK